MTWALGYYKAYRFEISQKATDDMILDDVVDLASGNANVTFTDVLEEILSAASTGYSEFLVVAHGSPKGLIMPLGPGLHSADKDNLPAMTEMAGIVTEKDRLNAITNSKQQVAEWIKLLQRVSGTRIAGGATWGHIYSPQLDAIASAADAQKWLETMAPTVHRQSILTNPSSVKLLDLRNKVVAKKLNAGRSAGLQPRWRQRRHVGVEGVSRSHQGLGADGKDLLHPRIAHTLHQERRLQSVVGKKCTLAAERPFRTCGYAHLPRRRPVYVSERRENHSYGSPEAGATRVSDVRRYGWGGRQLRDDQASGREQY